MAHVILAIFLLLISNGITQNYEGDPCVVEYINIIGRCVPPNKCKGAEKDYQFNGIKPTFCEDSFQQRLVCCRDGSTILQIAPTESKDDESDKANSNLRVSERKCQQYSRAVVQKVNFITLLPSPETMTVSVADCYYIGVKLIVGGEDASRGEFPHMAAIGWVDFDSGYTFSCSGSLISPKFVLTAGHCIYNPRAQNRIPSIVRLGDQNLDTSVGDGADPIEVPIKKIHKHPDYKSPKQYNDIALMELAAEVDFNNNIRPACLWSAPDVGSYTKAVATGWGITDPNTQQTSKELQKVSLSLLNNDYCDPLLPKTRNWKGFVPSQVCAGELQGGKDTCQGDSGSPLQVASNENPCIFHIVGITSFGGKCARVGQPAVYTRVSSYLDWIESVVWPDDNNSN